MLKTAHKIFVARAVYRAVSLLGLWRGTTVVTRRGIRWRLDAREGIDLTILLRGVFEASTHAVLAGLARDGHTIVDVGANIGAHALPLARRAGTTGRVIAFEPTDFAFAKLIANLELNPDLAPRVTARQRFLVGKHAALPAEGVPSSWPVDGARADDPVMGSRRMSTAGARAARLDDELRDLGVTRVDLVKMDVDGHESDVLAGAPELLRRDGPPIVMELAPYAHTGRGFEDMVETLVAAGYAFEALAGRRPLPGDAALLRRTIPEGASVNVIARRSA